MWSIVEEVDFVDLVGRETTWDRLCLAWIDDRVEVVML